MQNAIIRTSKPFLSPLLANEVIRECQRVKAIIRIGTVFENQSIEWEKQQLNQKASKAINKPGERKSRRKP